MMIVWGWSVMISQSQAGCVLRKLYHRSEGKNKTQYKKWEVSMFSRLFSRNKCESIPHLGRWSLYHQQAGQLDEDAWIGIIQIVLYHQQGNCFSTNTWSILNSFLFPDVQISKRLDLLTQSHLPKWKDNCLVGAMFFGEGMVAIINCQIYRWLHLIRSSRKKVVWNFISSHTSVLSVYNKPLTLGLYIQASVFGQEAAKDRSFGGKSYREKVDRAHWQGKGQCSSGLWTLSGNLHRSSATSWGHQGVWKSWNQWASSSKRWEGLTSMA